MRTKDKWGLNKTKNKFFTGFNKHIIYKQTANCEKSHLSRLQVAQKKYEIWSFNELNNQMQLQIIYYNI